MANMISTKDKLRNLKDHMENADKVLCDFAKYFADCMNDTLVPQEFVMAYTLCIEDLKRGECGFHGITIPRHLCGYPPGMYHVLQMFIPELAEATCDPVFAKEVKIFWDED